MSEQVNELEQLGYKPGEVTRNTFIYYDKNGKLSGMECAPDARPADYGGDGFYPSAIWVDRVGADMRTAFNQGKL